MAGTYTDIISITAPSSAAAGETVPVTVRVKNIHDYSFRISVAVTYEPGPVRFIGPEDYYVAAGATRSWSGSFTMPSSDATIWAYSSYWDGNYWRSDDEKSAMVTLEVKMWILEQTITGLDVEGIEEIIWILEQTITGLSVEGVEEIMWILEQTITELGVEATLHQGAIVAKLLDVDNIWHNIPLEVEQDTKTRVKIITRNTGSITYHPTCVYEVRDPDGVLAAPKYEHTAIDAASPGEETSFFPVFETFILRELGDYTLEIWLQDETGDLLDHWEGELCAVKEEAPPPPPPCTPGETKCIGPDLYECSLEGEWVLAEKDSPECVVEEKEFPWLLVAGGLGAAALVVVATTKKKKPAKEKRA